MPRPNFTQSQPWSEMIVAVLLYCANGRLPPDLPASGIKYEVSGQDIRVTATPDALVSLIEHYASDLDFQKMQRQNLMIWRKSMDKYAKVRDAITAMSKRGIILESQRQKSNPTKIRNFLIRFPQPLSEIEENCLWFQKRWSISVKDSKILDLSQYTQKEINRLSLATVAQAIEIAKLKIGMGQFNLAKDLLHSYDVQSDRSMNGKIHHYLGVIYQSQEDFNKAKTHFLIAQSEFDEIQHPHDLADNHHHLGTIFIKQKNWEDSKHHLESAMRLRQDDILALNSSRKALGDLFCLQGDKIRAEKIYLEVIKTGKKNSLPVAFSHSSLANIYAQIGENKRAKIEYQQAIEIIEFSYFDNHHSLPMIKSGLAAVYFALGEHRLAQELYFKSLNQAISIYGKNHVIVAIISADLAFLLGTKTQYRKQALQILLNAKAILEQLDPLHPSLKRIIDKLEILIAS